MKVLFIAGPSPATIFALAPLATAMRNAGHQAFMASTEEMMPVVEGIGLPPVSATTRTMNSLLFTDRQGRPIEVPQGLQEEKRHAGAWFGRLAAASLESLRALAEGWRPDLIVGGTLSYVAPLLSAHLSVPYVRHAWDGANPVQLDPFANEELRPELGELGLERIPEPAVFIDICPPSLRPPGMGPAQQMRWIPGNLQRKLEPWMYSRGHRRRILVTSGSRVSFSDSHDFLHALVKNVASLEAEVVVAAPEDAAAKLREGLPGIRAGWIPLDVVAPTCDVIVHHGGGVTSMTAINAGTPQLAIPQWALFAGSLERVAAYGAALTLSPTEATPDAVVDACKELLANPGYRARAHELSQEMAAQPLPTQVVGGLEKLAAGQVERLT